MLNLLIEQIKFQIVKITLIRQHRTSMVRSMALLRYEILETVFLMPMIFWQLFGRTTSTNATPIKPDRVLRLPHFDPYNFSIQIGFGGRSVSGFGRKCKLCLKIRKKLSHGIDFTVFHFGCHFRGFDRMQFSLYS